jgi:hypothetical protein
MAGGEATYIHMVERYVAMTSSRAVGYWPIHVPVTAATSKRLGTSEAGGWTRACVNGGGLAVGATSVFCCVFHSVRGC